MDERVTDRGVPSINGRPYEASEKAFYGNPDLSPSDVTVNSLTAVLEHEFSDSLELRTTVLYGDYDKFYQNIFAASAVNAANGTVQLAAYNSLTTRENLIGQTDLIWEGAFAGLEHTLLLGVEAGVQKSENVRIEGQFPAAGGLERLTVSVADAGATRLPCSAACRGTTCNDLNLLAVYAQDQVKLTEQLQVIAGVRFDRFDFEFDNRIGADAARTDEFVSPRLGVVYEPMDDLAVYASWARSYLPQSGEQFGNLTPALADFDPEEFENTEVGIKWQPSHELLLTAALFRLDRTNTPGAGTRGRCVRADRRAAQRRAGAFASGRNHGRLGCRGRLCLAVSRDHRDDQLGARRPGRAAGSRAECQHLEQGTHDGPA